MKHINAKQKKLRIPPPKLHKPKPEPRLELKSVHELPPCITTSSLIIFPW